MMLIRRKEDPGLIGIGYWCDWKRQENMHLPDPRKYVDPTWDEKVRAGVVLYLRRAPVLHSWRGWSDCRFCGDMNSVCLSDGKYVWPEGFAHYLEQHGVRPPRVFIDHAIEQTKEHP